MGLVRKLHNIVIPYPSIEFEESENLSESSRGKGGFGSTGDK